MHQLDALGVDQHELDLVGVGAHQDRRDERVDEARLAGAGRPGDQHVRHLGEVHELRSSVHVLAERDGQRVLVVDRRLRAQDVAEHHEVADLVRQLDADRGATRDRRDDPHVGRRERVRDVVGERQHLVDLGAGLDLHLVQRDRRPAMRRHDVRRHAEGVEGAFERGLLVLLVAFARGRRRRRSEQLERRELVRSVPRRPDERGDLDRLELVFLLILGELEQREVLAPVDDLGFDELFLFVVLEGLLLFLVFVDLVAGEGLHDPIPDRRQRRAGEDQEPEEHGPAPHDGDADRGHELAERPRRQRPDDTGRAAHPVVPAERPRVPLPQRDEREHPDRRDREPDEHPQAVLLGRPAEQDQPPVQREDREDHRRDAERGVQEPVQPPSHRPGRAEPEPEHREEREHDETDPEGVAGPGTEVAPDRGPLLRPLAAALRRPRHYTSTITGRITGLRCVTS